MNHDEKGRIFYVWISFVYVQNRCCIIFFPHKKSFIIFNLNITSHWHCLYILRFFSSYLRKKWKEKAPERRNNNETHIHFSSAIIWRERKKWEKIMLRASWNIKSIFIEIYVHKISQKIPKIKGRNNIKGIQNRWK